MATFDNATARNVGTSAVNVTGAVPAGKTFTITNLNVANVLTSDVTADVYINDGANDTHLIKDATVVIGGAEDFAANSKIILTAGDSLYVKSDTASGLDVVVGYLES